MRKGPAAKAPELPARRAPRVILQRALPTELAVRGSVSLFLVEAGRQGIREETLTARPSTQFEAETLELDPGKWVVQVLRASYSSKDTPVHTLETIFAATRHVFPIRRVAGVDEF